MAKAIIIFLLNFFFGITTKREITGIDKIPTDEKAIIVGNHIGFLDGLMLPTIPVLIKHPNLIVVIAEKYEEVPLFQWAVNKLGFMFIDRFKPDIKTLKKVMSMLKDDGILVISPEGTRSPDAALIEPKPGAAYLAAKTGATLVPIGVTGSEDKEVKKRFRRLRRLDVKIKIGDPFKIPSLPFDNREDFLKKYTDEIMCQIAALLPPSYRGVYANHPRLQEILSVP
jgi:1-acyl-sn-glycerol-3-phosphate acyltransferase